MELYDRMAQQIISEQEKIIGPIAVEQAKNIKGMHVDWGKREVHIDGDPKQTLESLVGKFKELFGKVAIEVCREAVKSTISQAPKDTVPQMLL